jgi:hypothetical protein
MENASKALLMAAGVLIGILILSLAVYLIVSFGNTSAEIHKQNEVQQLEQFNSQFTSYEGTECTIYDIVTLANLATENNIYYEFEKRSNVTSGSDNYISVVYNGSYIEKGYNYKGTIDYNKLISNELKNISKSNNLTKYKCSVEISTTTQRVYKVTFTK